MNNTEIEPGTAAKTFSLLSFNVLKEICSGDPGDPERGPRAPRIADIVAELSPDLVNFQELYPGDSDNEFFTIGMRDLLRERGHDYWYYDSGQMLSRFPRGDNLHRPLPFCRSRGWEVRTPFGLDLLVFNVHLRAYPFGPNYVLWENDVKSPLDNSATRDRLKELTAIDKISQEAEYRDWPVIVAGDFNCVSHLDWTKCNSRFCGNEADAWPADPFPWKESLHMDMLGFQDSYRDIHPLAEREGITYDSIYWGSNPGPTSMERERIDFIHYRPKGRITAVTSETIGDPKCGADRAMDNWPSDHSALLTTFQVE